MKITTVTYQDADGWMLEPMALNGFNLLVGVSGAGKTRIVRAIERICAVAVGTRETEEYAEEARGASFRIEFAHDGASYLWEVTLEPPAQPVGRQSGARSATKSPLIHSERLIQGSDTIVERTPEHFSVRGLALLRLDREKSAIAILKEDPAWAALYVAFSRCIFRQLDERPGEGSISGVVIDAMRQQLLTVDALGAAPWPELHGQAAVVNELFPEAFLGIEALFREAFPLVEKLGILRQRSSPDRDWYRVSLAIREAGVADWIPFHKMSSGMQRYLSFLIHLSYAPRGTVVLIDELESSLGTNCLPAATRFLLSRAPDLQLILTSHHPYIIEQIPPSHWKIVTRQGSHVRVLDAGKIPALAEGRTHLDRFSLLINLPEYDQWAQG